MKATDLRRRRLTLGWSQSKLAAELGVSLRTVIRAENDGKTVSRMFELALERLESQVGK